jgi:hypothetical protein
MFDCDVDPDAFLAWLADVDESEPPPPPVPESPEFADEFAQAHGDECAEARPLDPAGLELDAQLDRLLELGRQIAGLDAQRQLVLAAIAAQDGTVEGWSAELVSCVLRVPTRTAQGMLAAAQTLTESLPGTLQALHTGVLSLRHAQAITEAAWQLPPDRPELAARLEQRVLGRAGDQSLTQLRRALRQAVIALDPASAEARHHTARADRGVQLCPGEDGMAELRALLPAPDAELLYRRLTDATRLLPGTDPRSRDQQRADLLIDAVQAGIPTDALPTRHGRRPASTSTSTPTPCSDTTSNPAGSTATEPSPPTKPDTWRPTRPAPGDA